MRVQLYQQRRGEHGDGLVFGGRDGGPHLVVAGGGFAGLHAARALAAATRGAARVRCSVLGGACEREL